LRMVGQLKKKDFAGFTRVGRAQFNHKKLSCSAEKHKKTICREETKTPQNLVPRRISTDQLRLAPFGGSLSGNGLISTLGESRGPNFVGPSTREALSCRGKGFKTRWKFLPAEARFPGFRGIARKKPPRSELL